MCIYTQKQNVFHGKRGMRTVKTPPRELSQILITQKIKREKGTIEESVRESFFWKLPFFFIWHKVLAISHYLLQWFYIIRLETLLTPDIFLMVLLATVTFILCFDWHFRPNHVPTPEIERCVCVCLCIFEMTLAALEKHKADYQKKLAIFLSFDAFHIQKSTAKASTAFMHCELLTRGHHVKEKVWPKLFSLNY